MVNKDLCLEHPIPFHLCEGLINVMQQNFLSDKREKGGNMILEVKRDFDNIADKKLSDSEITFNIL